MNIILKLYAAIYYVIALLPRYIIRRLFGVSVFGRHFHVSATTAWEHQRKNVNSTIDSQKRHMYAIGVILFAMVALAFQSLGMKYFSTSLNLWQITVYRSLIILSGFIPFILIAKRAGRLRINGLKWIVIRSMLMVAMNLLYYAALPLMGMAVASTASYTAPMFITILAALILGEKISKINVACIVAAFIGTVMMVNPAGSEFNMYVIFPLLSAIAYGSAHIVTRWKCQNESPMILAVMVHFSFLFAGLVATFFTTHFSDAIQSISNFQYLTGSWVPMNMHLWLVIAGFAILNTITHLGFAKAYQIAPSSVVAPWEYTYILFVVILSFLTFNEVPSSLTIGGMVIIISSGLVMMFSEQINKRLVNTYNKKLIQNEM